MDNKLSIFKYFEDRKWKELDFKQTDWTKHTKYDIYSLGKQKNNEGMPINCKGVVILANYGRVTIGAFNQDGNMPKPYIYINKNGFEIYE